MDLLKVKISDLRFDMARGQADSDAPRTDPVGDKAWLPH
jgi:hypothetical protein